MGGFARAVDEMIKILINEDRLRAIECIKMNHYTHSVPSGKSYYMQFNSALIVYSIPANKNIARFLLGFDGNVWELSRLWAPDNHEKNLLTQAIARSAKQISKLESLDALVSYADPNAGHKGGVYRAASWIYTGQCEESRAYIDSDGNIFARRAFHSGKKGRTKAQIEALGFKELHLPGKYRFVRPFSIAAKRAVHAN